MLKHVLRAREQTESSVREKAESQ
ncbi:hypothetical protein KUCAC02_007320 [Chaenocephalus aceratus]|uniref:Uncharacterized protein n=1 Tax=Chaenocephalus aceratus TaxID=36190 RepID=A0ACB9X708_CHAAC|nr:hypothetical protein KUCAC02_007320 [Chaenocephalus aceratus]